MQLISSAYKLLHDDLCGNNLDTELNQENNLRGARLPSGRASDSGARGRRFDTYLRRVVSLSKDTFNP